ncbi:hypothetical protein KCP69_09850 [Salmonella enterica subsp. enterica]|nr:hypothetical protein KCP69_09850 [Salmonella enterica subsp. enterica]
MFGVKYQQRARKQQKHDTKHVPPCCGLQEDRITAVPLAICRDSRHYGACAYAMGYPPEASARLRDGGKGRER